MTKWVPVLVTGAAVVMAALWWLRHRPRDQQSLEEEEDDIVDVTSKDSFPASDPPSWNRVRV